MEDIELLLARDARHFHCQRQGVIRIFEEAVFIHHHLVEEDARLRNVQADWPGRAEEVHLVAAPRQFRTKRGGENPAPADQRVTGDPNPERTRSFHVQKRRMDGGNWPNESKSRWSQGKSACAYATPASWPRSRARAVCNSI